MSPCTSHPPLPARPSAPVLAVPPASLTLPQLPTRCSPRRGLLANGVRTPPTNHCHALPQPTLPSTAGILAYTASSCLCLSDCASRSPPPAHPFSAIPQATTNSAFARKITTPALMPPTCCDLRFTAPSPTSSRSLAFFQNSSTSCAHCHAQLITPLPLLNYPPPLHPFSYDSSGAFIEPHVDNHSVITGIVMLAGIRPLQFSF